ncbi:hypothetical protein CVS40_0627 [Lucilia cuprina]|nr:hypothetical protein CVS40_0627 [Lucilia cuprina]
MSGINTRPKSLVKTLSEGFTRLSALSLPVGRHLRLVGFGIGKLARIASKVPKASMDGRGKAAPIFFRIVSIFFLIRSAGGNASMAANSASRAALSSAIFAARSGFNNADLFFNPANDLALATALVSDGEYSPGGYTFSGFCSFFLFCIGGFFFGGALLGIDDLISRFPTFTLVVGAAVDVNAASSAFFF